MRYGISPAERNLALDELHAMNRATLPERTLPKIRGLELEERMEEGDHKRLVKQKLYGRMAHRRKPEY